MSAAPRPVAYRSASRRAERLRLGLQLVVVAAVLRVLAAVDRILITREYLDGHNSLRALGAADDLQVVTIIGQAVALIVALALLLPWQARALANLDVLGARCRWTGRMAWGVWLIPGLNLVAPKQVTDDLWRSGEAGRPTRESAADYARRPLARVVHGWWALWLVPWTGWLVATFVGTPTDLADFPTWDWVDAGVAVLVALWAGTTMTLTERITTRQDARAEELAAGAVAGLAAGLAPWPGALRPRPAPAASRDPEATAARRPEYVGSPPG